MKAQLARGARRKSPKESIITTKKESRNGLPPEQAPSPPTTSRVRFPSLEEQARGLTEKPSDPSGLPPLKNNTEAAMKARLRQVQKARTAHH
jgi:hypothetical protein